MKSFNWSRRKFIGASAVAWAGLAAAARTRALTTASRGAEPLSLAGRWRFQLDREDKGIAERWFQGSLAEAIRLPGALQNQGFGDAITANTKWTGGEHISQYLELPRYERYRQPGNVKVPFFLQPEKHYVGVAWYQRDIDMPADWSGRRVVLTLERPHWETQVWLDDKAIGSNNGLSTPHVYELGTELKAGRHRLSIRVDNRLIVDVGALAHSVSDETQGNWNGIVGAITLTTTSLVWIEDAQAYPNVAKRGVLVRVRVGNASGKSGAGTLTVGPVSQKIDWSAAGGTAEAAIDLGQDARTWDEFTPVLQRLKLSLRGDGADNERTLIFGLREMAVQGRQFLVNERPTFFRGTLECCIFPLTGYPPTDVDAWKRIIRTCQAHGLNHIRFHSWCPPEAAFVAADELGFYYSVEVAAWTAVGQGQPVDQWLYGEAARILKAYGNHPSFMLMPYGNEPGKEGAETRNPWLAAWVKHWISVDPRRLYTSASGWPPIPENQYHVSHGTRGIEGWFGRDYREILGKAQLPRATVKRVTVPVIVHEMGQWCVYPNFDEIAKYTGPLKPKNFEIFRDSLAEHGMADRWEDFFTASGKLQVLCYKEEIEAALRTPGIGGIQLLDLHDFPGQGTALVGVLDPFWDAKPYVTATQYRRFCNTTVPLARLLRRTWTSDETLTAEIEVAHFGAGPLTNAMPYWRVLADNEKVIAQGELPAGSIPLGQGTRLGTVAVELRALPAPKRYKLVVGLKGTDYENDWNFWVYPPKSPPAPSDLLVTVSWDAAARMRLEAGGRVLFASTRLGPDHMKLHFTPIFWNRFMFNKQSNSTLGLWCNTRHPALAQFPTDSWQDGQWLDIIPAGFGSAAGVILDDWPRELQPIVQPIDDWNSNRRLGLIFECRVGKGKLLVCAADLSSDLDRRPAARQLRDSLMAYAGSDRFDPQVQVPADQLANLWRE